MVTALRAIWLVVAVEFLLGRLFTRVGIFMPKNAFVLVLYRLLSDAGQIAFNLSLLAGLLALGYTLWRLAGPAGRGLSMRAVAAVAVVAALGTTLVPGLTPDPAWSLATALLAAAAVAGLGIQALTRTTGPWRQVGLAAALLANLTWYGVAVAQMALALGSGTGEVALATAVLRGGELLAVLAPVLLAAGLCLERRRTGLPPAPWRAVLLGLAGGILFVIGYGLGADMTGVLAMWSLGFTLSWPGWLYALALAAGIFFLTGAASWPPDGRVQAAGLGILWCTGYALQVNQQHVLVLLAWAVLAAGGAVLDRKQDLTLSTATP